MSVKISGGFTFFGYIPENSPKQHLGIVLGANELLLKYCYCTSKLTRIINHIDFITIPAEKMRVYFSNPQDSYIFLSTRHIHEMLIITFRSRLNSEYDVKPLLDKDIFSSILSRIRNSDNLSERFKKEFFESIEIK